MSRSEALERYRELPVPGTTEEHWRFTDLKDFDPEAFAGDGSAAEAPTQSMLELDVAGVATVTETGIEISRAPDEIRFDTVEFNQQHSAGIDRQTGREHARFHCANNLVVHHFQRRRQNTRGNDC